MKIVNVFFFVFRQFQCIVIKWHCCSHFFVCRLVCKNHQLFIPLLFPLVSGSICLISARCVKFFSYTFHLLLVKVFNSFFSMSVLNAWNHFVPFLFFFFLAMCVFWLINSGWIYTKRSISNINNIKSSKLNLEFSRRCSTPFSRFGCFESKIRHYTNSHQLKLIFIFSH